jgi:hypothetical protein
MKLTEEELKKAKSLTDPSAKKLVEFYEFMTNNSAYESYVSRRVTLGKWDEELIRNPVSLFSDDDDEEKAKARDKEVDRVLKYLEKQVVLHEQTETLLTKLTGEEQEAINRDKRLQKASQDRQFRPMTTKNE